MPTHYHISCRVRAVDQGIDATTEEHADTVIETNGTPFAALCIWLLKEDSWLKATPHGLKLLAESLQTDPCLRLGWDSYEDGGMECHNDWRIDDFLNNVDCTLNMDGTANCGEFKFEVRVKPAKVSNEETAWSEKNEQEARELFDAQNCQEYTDACRLLDLSDDLAMFPVRWGVAATDLRAIAARLSEQAVKDHAY
jgi:hypothetical protein